MAINALAVVGPGQEYQVANLQPLSPADLEILVDFVYPSNNVGAIAAQMERAFLKFLLASILSPASLTDTWVNAESTRPLSAAGGLALYNSLRSAITTAVSQVKADLLGGAGAAYDSLKELADIEITEQATLDNHELRIAALAQAVQAFVKMDGSTAITAPQKIVDATGLFHAATYGQVLAGVNFGFPQAVNVGATGIYPMGTTRADSAKVFLFTSLYAKLVSTSGTIATAAAVTIGTNAPAYDNIVKSLGLGALTVVGENIPLSYHVVDIAPGTPIFANVKVAQIGGSSTYTFFGFGQYR